MRIAVFTKNRSNPAYEAARMGADRAARLLGAETLHFVPEKDDDPDEQVALIDRAIGLPPDAIVLTPVHPVKVDAALARINASGIPLCGFVNPMPQADCISYAGSDDHALGTAIAQHLYAHLGGRGRVLLVSGHVESVTSIARLRAFHDAAKAQPGIAIAGTCVGDYQRGKARDSVAAWLRGNDAPDAVLCANDIMAIGVIDALRDAGKAALVAGVNAIPEAIEAIKRGDMLATADFNAMRMAYLATECAIRHLRGEAVPKVIELPVEIVHAGNCRQWDLPYDQRPIPPLKETLG